MIKHLPIQYPHAHHLAQAPPCLWKQQCDFIPPSNLHSEAPARRRRLCGEPDPGDTGCPLPFQAPLLCKEPRSPASHSQGEWDLPSDSHSTDPGFLRPPSHPPSLLEGCSNSGRLYCLGIHLILSVAFCQEEICVACFAQRLKLVIY